MKKPQENNQAQRGAECDFIGLGNLSDSGICTENAFIEPHTPQQRRVVFALSVGGASRARRVARCVARLLVGFHGEYQSVILLHRKRVVRSAPQGSTSARAEQMGFLCCPEGNPEIPPMPRH